MKIYKYRELTPNTDIPIEEKLNRIYDIVINGQLWCAAPDSLNDKDDEFAIQCDYTYNVYTKMLLAKDLERNGIDPLQAKLFAANTIDKNTLESIISNVIESNIEKSRNEYGIISMSCNRDDAILWKEYGGAGNGVCIEIEIPDSLVNIPIYKVNYVPSKIFTVNTFLRTWQAKDNEQQSFKIYLATKTDRWQTENEMRYITKGQSIKVDINSGLSGSVTEVMFGHSVPQTLIDEIRGRITDSGPAHSIVFAESALSVSG